MELIRATTRGRPYGDKQYIIHTYPTRADAIRPYGVLQNIRPYENNHNTI